MRRISFEEAHALCGVPWGEAPAYPVLWHDPREGVCGLHRLMFHSTVHVGIDAVGYRTRYCFATPDLAMRAFDEWNGEGDPDYWHKHPDSGRMRERVGVVDGMAVYVKNGQVVALMKEG